MGSFEVQAVQARVLEVVDDIAAESQVPSVVVDHASPAGKPGFLHEVPDDLQLRCAQN